MGQKLLQSTKWSLTVPDVDYCPFPSHNIHVSINHVSLPIFPFLNVEMSYQPKSPLVIYAQGSIPVQPAPNEPQKIV